MEEAHWGFTWESMTEKCVTAFLLAQQEAEFLDDAQIGTEHLLIGLLGSQSLGAQILAEFGVDVMAVRAHLHEVEVPQPGTRAGVRAFSWRLRRAVEVAFEEARGSGKLFVNTNHLIIGLLSQEDSRAHRLLETLHTPLGEVLDRLRRDHDVRSTTEGWRLVAEEMLGQLRVASDVPGIDVVPPSPPVTPTSAQLGLEGFLAVLDELSLALQAAQHSVESVLPRRYDSPEPLPRPKIVIPEQDDSWPVLDEEVYQIGGFIRQILSVAVLHHARRVIFEPSDVALRIEYQMEAGRCESVLVPAILRDVVPFRLMRMARLNPMEKGRELEGKLSFRYRGRAHRMTVHSEPIRKGLRVEVVLEQAP